MIAKTQRLDLLLLEQGFFASREVAQSAIMNGYVFVEGKKETKPGKGISHGAKVTLSANFKQQKYVSRGGLKLEKGLAHFAVQPHNRICVDIGASTGGFTDCLLQHGACKVYAIDVGYGQLAWSLRQNPQVLVKERTNIRYLSPIELYGEENERASLLVIDVSFISLTLVLGPSRGLLEPEMGEIICLVKPQFEAGRSEVGKGGVVQTKTTHVKVLEEVINCALTNSLLPMGLTFSPLKGPAGNIEFLLHLRDKTWVKQESIECIDERNKVSISLEDITLEVEKAHAFFIPEG